MAHTAPRASTRASWNGRLLAAALLAASCAAAYWLAFSGRRLAAPASPLVVDERSLWFGDAWETKGFAWTLPVANQSGQDVEVLGFVTSCDCVSVQPKSLRIAPGETAQVRLQLDLTQADAPTKEAIRPFAVDVVPFIQGGLPPTAPWTVRGRVKKALSWEPRFVDFGEGLVRGQPFPEQTVVVTAHTPLAKLTAELDPACGTVRVRPLKDKEPRYQLTVTPAKSLPAGTLAGKVKLHAVTPAGERIPEIALTVRGTVSEDMQPTPAAVVHGPVPVGKLVEETITLRAVSGKPFTVEGLQTASADVRLEPSPHAVPGCQVFRLVQRVARGGDQREVVQILVRPSEGPAVAVPVRVLYHGIEPARPAAPPPAGTQVSSARPAAQRKE
jgi:hypothetical protein